MSSLLRIQKKPYNTSKEKKCAVCGFNEGYVLYKYKHGAVGKENIFDILECCSCSHMFIHPIPLENVDERITIDEASVDVLGPLKFIHEKLVIEKEIRNVKRNIQTNMPMLLDIGCGTGWTTDVWARHGFIAHGLEPSKNTSAIARQRYSLKVFTENIESFVPDCQYDVVVMRHVFEHIVNPGEILDKVRGMLKPGGMIVIIVPNINSIGRFLFKDNWSWILPYHVHFYKPLTLKTMLRNNEFECVKLYQMPSPLWYPESIIRSIERHNIIVKVLKTIPRGIFMVLCAPIILFGLIFNLNDNLTIIAKKL